MSFRSIILIILTTLYWSCAQQGSPSGGPRDEDPPLVLESSPENYSTHFEAKKIQITFDEYIVLDNVNQELVVSPPMEEKPEVRLKGKSLLIEFEEELKVNTTYTLNFGSAIKDLHEGNKLLNFEYVFSTGAELDSLSIRGTLKYAFDLMVPDEPITIMLYDDLRDSVPLTEIPYYVGRSDDSGVFSVNNLKADTFKVFALKDGNYNLIYDLPTEEIAFLDSTLIMNTSYIRSIMEPIIGDTAILNPLSSHMEPDSLAAAGDTSLVGSDSLKLVPDYNAVYLELELFIEEVENQYIMEDSREDPRKILFAFSQPLTDSFSYRFLQEPGAPSIDYLEIFATQRDSLTLWLMDSVDYQKDTLILELDYTVKDSTQLYVSRTDTLLMTYRKRAPKKGSSEPEEEKLLISTIRANSELDLNTDLKLDFNFPLMGILDSLIHFWQIPDSVELPIPFKLRADSMNVYRAWIETKWEEVSNYHLQILPGAFTSLYELEHDTLDLSFRTRDGEYYGTIQLTLDSVSVPVIIQITNQDNVVRQRRVYESGMYTFTHMSPREYGIKIIHDVNDNGKWDTGNYLKKIQPEKVEIPPGKVTVRSNWDHEVNMVLKKQELSP